MRDHSCHWLLLLLSITGCATSRPGTFAARPLPSTIVRAESEHLSELGEAARDKNSDSVTPRNDHHGKHHRSSAHCNHCNSSPCCCDSSDDTFSTLLGPVFFAVFTSPFTVPVALLGDDYSTTAAFPDYPYADDLPGSLLKSTEYDGATRGWTGTLQVFDIQETANIDRFGGRLVLDSASRFGIDTESNYWAEPGSAGASHLWTGDANLCFRFAESERVQFRAGVGVNWLADGGGAEAGFNFTYGMDWFPRKPWTVSTVFDLGTLGGGALVHNRTTVGVMLGPVEAFAGYDYFRLGSASFHGPVAGLGWRF